MNTTQQPAWLREAEEHYTDNAAREQLSAAYAIAAATPTPPDERSRTLVKLLLNLRSDATMLAAGLLVEPWRKKQLDLDALAASPCHGVIGLLQALDDLALIARKNNNASPCKPATCSPRWRTASVSPNSKANSKTAPCAPSNPISTRKSPANSKASAWTANATSTASSTCCATN